MNINNLVDISTSLKALDLKHTTKEQQSELYEIVNILDSSALVLDEVTGIYNSLIADEVILPTESSLQVSGVKANKAVSAELETPTWVELTEALLSLKAKLVNGNVIIIQNSIDRIEIAKTSAFKALSYLKTLDYVFDDAPKIILLS